MMKISHSGIQMLCGKQSLCDYSGVKGCLNYLPNGYAIWENIQSDLDKRFKDTGVENVYLPVLIPESLLAERKRPHRRVRA